MCTFCNYFLRLPSGMTVTYGIRVLSGLRIWTLGLCHVPRIAGIQCIGVAHVSKNCPQYSENFGSQPKKNKECCWVVSPRWPDSDGIAGLSVVPVAT